MTLLVNHNGLDAAATDLVRSSEVLQGVLDDLVRDLDARRDQWSGATQQAYLASRAQWEASLREMRELLAAIGQAVAQANQSYREADLRGSQRFGG